MVGGSRENLKETMVSTPTPKYGAVSRKFFPQPILGGHPQQPLLRVLGMDYNSNTWGYT